MTDHTLPDRLRALAESLVGDEWEHPIDAVETCRNSADELERLRTELAEAQASIAWLSGDQSYQPVPGERRTRS